MLARDLKQALRGHFRRPLATAAAVATLALGIGASSAIFSVAHGVLQPLGYPRSEELVRIHHTYEHLKTSTNARLRAIWNRIPVSYLGTLEWRRGSRHLQSIGLYSHWDATWTGAGEPSKVPAARVDSQLLATLDTLPVLGRAFGADEIEQRQRPLLLSHGFWQEHFGQNREVLGQELRLDDDLYTVIGVMPPGFRIVGGQGERLWAPLRPTEADLQSHDELSYQAIGRLVSSTSLERAQREMDTLSTRLAEAFPNENGELGVYLEPLLTHVVGDSRGMLLLLMAAVGVVLLIACVNVSHLLLARAAERRHELAVRAALGAGRARLIRQLVVESLLLALAGGLAGLALAAASHSLLLTHLPEGLPRGQDIRIDSGVLLFTFSASLLTGLVTGLLPALLTTRVSTDELKTGRQNHGRSSHQAHGSLVVAEIALTLMLTASAGLLVASFARLSAVDPGFATNKVLVQSIQLPGWRYDDPSRRVAYADRLLASLSDLPDVRHAALTTKLPLPGLSLVAGFRLPGVDTDEDQDWIRGRSASLKAVTPDYFQTLEIPILAGRVFASSDRQDTQLVVVINQTLAEQHWPGQDPVGQTLIMLSDNTYTVVGVVGDVHQEGVDTAPREMIYQPWAQSFRPDPTTEFHAVMALRADPLTLHQVLRGLDPMLALAPAVSLQGLVADSMSAPRYRTTLVGLFAVLALVLTLIGIHAILSSALSLRRREIAVRMALGASASHVRNMILRQALGLAGLGIVLGTLGALAGRGLLHGLLYGIGPTDPTLLFTAAALVLTTSLLAACLPARRASRIEPVKTLRGD